jgi:hypothetical protein
MSFEDAGEQIGDGMITKISGEVGDTNSVVIVSLALPDRMVRRGIIGLAMYPGALTLFAGR